MCEGRDTDGWGSKILAADLAAGAVRVWPLAFAAGPGVCLARVGRHRRLGGTALLGPLSPQSRPRCFGTLSSRGGPAAPGSRFAIVAGQRRNALALGPRRPTGRTLGNSRAALGELPAASRSKRGLAC